MSNALSAALEAARGMHKAGLISDDDLAEYEKITKSILIKRSLKKTTLEDFFNHQRERLNGVNAVLCENRPEWIVNDSNEGGLDE